MPKTGLSGREAYEAWQFGQEPEGFKAVAWKDINIYQIAAHSFDYFNANCPGNLKALNEDERLRIYEHVRELAYRATQDYIEARAYPATWNADQTAEPDADITHLYQASEAKTVSGYAQLFPETGAGYVESDSLFAWDSPAAYAVDLFREANDLDRSFGALKKRRPDLEETDVSNESVHQEMHELDQVIRILEGLDSDIDAILAKTYFPWSLPFEKPVVIVNRALRAKNSSLGNLRLQILGALPLGGSKLIDYAHLDLWMSYLGLAPQERDLLMQPVWTSQAEVANYFGPPLQTAVEGGDRMQGLKAILTIRSISIDSVNS